MNKTVVIKEFGGSDKLKIIDMPVGDPAEGQVRIAHKACGLNFIDVYQRSGLAPLNLPQALGMEAAGIIEAVGEGVTHLKVGDRAAYASMPPGHIVSGASCLLRRFVHCLTESVLSKGLQ